LFLELGAIECKRHPDAELVRQRGRVASDVPGVPPVNARYNRECEIWIHFDVPLVSCNLSRLPQPSERTERYRHVEGNVPPGKLFDELLTRDLNDYFCRNSNDCKVQYELLRDGPTQSGTSYPKYYLWVRFTKGGTVAGEGAVRVAAIDQKRFEVTHFLSRELISQAPSQVASIFPAALVNKIVEKAHTSFNSQR
jgi:hypothetical protein